jgi:hypothetical protein
MEEKRDEVSHFIPSFVLKKIEENFEDLRKGVI